MRLSNVILPFRGPNQTFDTVIADNGALESVRPTGPPAQPGGEGVPPSLLLPSLCHPHLHLDKPYLLTGNCPAYADLTPGSGSFDEALRATTRAKERYTPENLYQRGAQLLAASHTHGVTVVRAFVEIDHVVGLVPLAVAARLRRDFAHLVNVQICAFAQDPLFSGSHGAENLDALSHALDTHAADIDVLGTAPYVESTPAAAHKNIRWAVSNALEKRLHLDFHLDYNLDPPLGDTSDDKETSPPDQGRKPMIHIVLEALKAHSWPTTAAATNIPTVGGPPGGGTTGQQQQQKQQRPLRTVVLGHCTQLTQLSRAQLVALANTIKSSRLPVYLVGLPTSDIYMMGRPEQAGVEPDTEDTTKEEAIAQRPHARPRGTLQVVSLARDLGLGVCLGVNNVGNAFGPFGTGDPLALASWGVGLYHAGGNGDAEILYGCVSHEAKRAIGLLEIGVGEGGVKEEKERGERGEGEKHESAEERAASGGPEARWLLVENKEWIEVPGAAGDAGPGGPERPGQAFRIPARQRLTIRDVVWDPPEAELRRVVP